MVSNSFSGGKEPAYIHDPLCLCAEDDYRCGDCYDDCVCGCFDIRRVRPLIVNATLDAAREAVLKACAHTKYEGCSPCCHDDCVAAIDALRGEL